MMSRQGQRLAGWIVMVAVAVLCVGCDRASNGGLPVMGSADMVIKGHLVDEQGKALRGVQCRVESFSPGGHEGLMSRRVRSLEPDFELSFDKVIRADLTFMAEGYEYLDVAFEANAVDPDVQIVSKAQHYERTFTLVKKVSTPLLYRYCSRLEIRPDGMYTMESVDRLDSNPYDDPLKDQRAIEDTTTTINVAYPYIYANLRPQPGEEPVIRQFDFGESHEASPRDKVAQLCLANGDPGDGFALHSMQPKDYKLRFFPPEMAAVPDAIQFAPTLDVPKELFVETDSRPFPRSYFYFRLKGKYGKGRCEVSYNCDTGELELDVELYLQPDGSRDVRTRGE